MKKLFIFVFLCALSMSLFAKGEDMIEVVGQSTILIPADKVSLNVRYETQAPTTKEAREKTNGIITQILDILDKAGIQKKEIETKRLRLSPVTKWQDNENKVIGQKAEQELEIHVDNTPSRATEIAALIDELSEINQIQLSDLDFYRDDTSSFQKEGLEKAFLDAKKKAEVLADVAGISLGKVRLMRVADAQGGRPVPLRGSRAKMKKTTLSASQDQTQILAGTESFETTLIVVFNIE